MIADLMASEDLYTQHLHTIQQVIARFFSIVACLPDGVTTRVM